jgi:hypothetical protein
VFSYYGTKLRIAKYYPKPEYDTIIEPFCGAAQYSLFGDNWEKDVILVDKYDKICRIWKYLINSSKREILSLPDLEVGENVDSFNQLCDEEKWLIGFSINTASAMPKKTASKRSAWNRHKIFIANNQYKVRHWEIVNGDYTCLKNIRATWFIDSPYQHGGIYYRMNSSKIDYPVLANWCKERLGQTIVCENTKADWLDFKPLVTMNGQLHKTTEAIWTREE